MEVDYADLGVASHRLRVVAGPPSLIAPLRHTSRYHKRYRSVADVFQQAKVPMRSDHIRTGSVSASASAATTRRNVRSVTERAFA